MNSVVIKNKNLEGKKWTEVSTYLRSMGFSPCANGIWTKVFEDDNEKDACFFALKNWLKGSLSNVLIERFPMDEENEISNKTPQGERSNNE